MLVKLTEKSTQLHSNFAFFLHEAHTLGDTPFVQIRVFSNVLKRLLETLCTFFQTLHPLETGGHVVMDHEGEIPVPFAILK